MQKNKFIYDIGTRREGNFGKIVAEILRKKKEKGERKKNFGDVVAEIREKRRRRREFW